MGSHTTAFVLDTMRTVTVRSEVLCHPQNNFYSLNRKIGLGLFGPKFRSRLTKYIVFPCIMPIVIGFFFFNAS